MLTPWAGGSFQAASKIGNGSIELAPIVKSFPNGAVFKGAGNSHFTAAGGKFHLTEEIPGVGGLKFHYRIDKNGNVVFD